MATAKKEGASGNVMEIDLNLESILEKTSSQPGPSSKRSERKIKKDDSGISVEKLDEELSDSESDEKTDKGKLKLNAEASQRSIERNSPDSGHHDVCFEDMDCDKQMEPQKNDDGASVSGPKKNVDETTKDSNIPASKKRKAKYRVRDSGDGDDDSSEASRKKRDEHRESDDENWENIEMNDLDSDSDDEDKVDDESSKDSSDNVNKALDNEIHELTNKQKPKHKWFMAKELVQREYGMSPYYSSDLFRLRAYSSLHMVQRLELMAKMKLHEGCVNTLHFNATGTKLASGSDDLRVIIWDWTDSEPLVVYDSGHRSNVFQAKFMPLGGDCHIVSCARDGQVRLAELSSTGVCKNTKRLAQHRGGAHKLALEFNNPHTFLSCGEDSVVFEIDLRESKAHKILTCKYSDSKVALYSIFSNPSDNNEFVLGGRDHFVRVYDKRKICEYNSEVKKFCPHHLMNGDNRSNVTCVTYNYCGKEILATYNDEDIYTFDAQHSDGADFVHRYRGHRNNATVKGVNYFGPRSEYIVSGSDCGNIFLWEHGTESVVQFMAGDEGGVVNCLEPHPQLPVLATSGLDDDVKIWVPSKENAPDLALLENTVRRNLKDREEEHRREPETFDGQMLWYLMHQLRRTARRRNGVEVSSSSEEENNSDSDDSEGMSNPVQCAPS